MNTNKYVQTKTKKEKLTDHIFGLYRVAIVLTLLTLFMPSINPAKISKLINDNVALFTAGIDYGSLTANIIRAINSGWLQESSFILLFYSSMAVCISFAVAGVSACMSLGSLKFKILGNRITIIGSIVGMLGMVGIYLAYLQLTGTSVPEKVGAQLPYGFILISAAILIFFVLSILLLIMQPKPGEDDVYEMKQKYKLFLLLSPFIVAVFVFGYLQVWGLRFAFFDYSAGDNLSADKFVGMKWFTYLLQSEASRRDIVRVMKNTLAMSALGLSTSWCAMAFAIFLCEIKSIRLRRLIQTLTTVPNFISWVMVYVFAFVLFSTDGFFSNLITSQGGSPVNFLMSGSHMWLKMLAWGMWKGIGWSAIIYIAGISGIDQQLYEAATVDGAGRFKRMWHITVPSLLPTFLVLFLMAVSGILNNGLDQYLVFRNPNNTKTIEVLDLYVYRLGIVNGIVPLSTAIGILKTFVGIVLLLITNRISKAVRGNTII